MLSHKSGFGDGGVYVALPLPFEEVFAIDPQLNKSISKLVRKGNTILKMPCRK